MVDEKMPDHRMSNQNMLNCEEVWREISNYVDGDVDAGLHSAMDEHFRTCSRCASLLAGMRNVIKLYGDERLLEVPAGFSVRLKKRIERGVAEDFREHRQWWSSWTAWLIPAVAVLLIAGGVWMTNTLTFQHFVRSHQAEPANNIPPDLQVVVSDGEKLFHVPGCKFIKDPSSERTMTAKEAMQEGYAPCTRCLRKYLKTGLISPQRTNDRDEDAEEESEQPVVGAALQ